MKFSVIDIGSNSVRLMIMSDGKSLLKTIDTTRLGERIAVNGFLLDEAMERTVLAIKRFRIFSSEYGVEKIYAFATAAVRSASNKEIFIDRVKKECGIDIEVISGEEEAVIGLNGAVGKNDGGILDVGGASSELVFRKDGQVAYRKSLDIGAVRLFDLCGRDGSKLISAIDEKIGEYGDVTLPVDLYGIGGTATSLAAVKLKLKDYDPEKVNGCILYSEEIREIADNLLTISVKEITEKFCLNEKRAEIIAGGAMLVYRIMKKINVKKIIVSESDNLEGYAAVKGLI